MMSPRKQRSRNIFQTQNRESKMNSPIESSNIAPDSVRRRLFAKELNDLKSHFPNQCSEFLIDPIMKKSKFAISKRQNTSGARFYKLVFALRKIKNFLKMIKNRNYRHQLDRLLTTKQQNLTRILNSEKEREFLKIPHFYEVLSRKKIQNAQFWIELEHKFCLDSIKEECAYYFDLEPFLNIRLKFLYFIRISSLISQKILKSSLFKLINIIQILLSFIVSASNYNRYSITLFSLIFLIFEIFLKIIAFGLFSFSRLFRNPLNIIDFIIIIIAFLTNLDYNFVYTRIFRIFYYLPLKEYVYILSGVLQSSKILISFLIILGFFIGIFAISSTLLFSGIIEKENEITNFDYFQDSLLQIMRLITFESFSNIVNKIDSRFALFYFIIITLFGNFFLINLIIGTLKVKFNELKTKFENLQNNQNYKQKKIKIKKYDFKICVANGLYRRKKLIKTNLLIQRLFKKNENIQKIFDFFNGFYNKIGQNIYPFVPNTPASLIITPSDYRINLKSRKSNSNSSLDSSIFLSPATNKICRKIENIPDFIRKSRLSCKKNSLFESPLTKNAKINKGFFQNRLSRKESTIIKTMKKLEEQKFPISNFDSFNKSSNVLETNFSILYIVERIKKNFVKLKKCLKIFRTKNFEQSKNKGEKWNFYLAKIVKNDMEYISDSLEDVLPLQKEKKIEELVKKLISLQNLKLKTKYTLNDLVYKDLVSKTRNSVKRLKSFHEILIPHRKVSKLLQKEKQNKKMSDEFKPLLMQYTIQEKDNGSKTDINSLAGNSRIGRFRKIMLKKMDNRATYNKTAEIAGMSFSEVSDKNTFLENKNSEKKKKKEMKYDEALTIIDSPIHTKITLIQNFQEEYIKIHEKDFLNKKKDRYIWSGHDILQLSSINYMRTKRIFNSLSYQNRNIWINGFEGWIIYFQRICNYISENNIFIYYYNLNVLVLIIVMGLENIIPSWRKINIIDILNYIFVTQLFLSLQGHRLKQFLNNKSNIIEIICCLYFLYGKLLEEFGNSLFKQYDRFIMIIYVLRIWHLIDYLDYMKIIEYVFKKTVVVFVFILILIFLTIGIYSILGRDLYLNKFKNIEIDNSHRNFDTFLESFVTIFSIMTLDNWDNIYWQCYQSDKNSKTLSMFFILSIIWVLGLILFNFLMTIILFGFESLQDEGIKQDKFKVDEEFTLFEIKQILNKYNCIVEEVSRKSLKQINKKNSVLNKFFFSSAKNSTSSNVPKMSNKFLITKNSKFKTQMVLDKNINLFDLNHKITIICQIMISNKIYEYFLQLLLFISILIILFETYLEENDTFYDFWSKIFEIITYIIYCFFTLDIFIKFVAIGIWDYYMKKKLNLIDLFSVFLFYVEIFVFIKEKRDILKFTGISFFRAIRLVKLFSNNKNMKILAKAIYQSLKGLLNVFIIVFTVWFVFAIIGINLYSSRFGYCISPINFNQNINKCTKSDWKIHEFNFDNIGNAFFTLFVISTFDKWTVILNIAINSDLPDNGPIKDNNKWTSYIYFLSFILIGVLFFLNLLMGVIFSNFSRAQKRAKSKYLNNNQLKWLALHASIVNTTPFIYTRPVKKFKRKIFDLVNSNFFHLLIQLSILLYFFLLCFYSRKNTTKIEYLVNLFSGIICLIYICEFTLKINALGYRGYFSNRWNIIEALICIGLSISLVFDILISSNITEKSQNKVDSFIRFIDFLRISPFIRIFQKFGSHFKIVRSLIFSFYLYIHIIILIFIIFFWYGLWGWLMFRNLQNGEIINESLNFKNIGSSMFLLLKIAILDDWSLIINDCNTYNSFCDNFVCISIFNYVFFLSFLAIIRFILFNMFVSIILQQFEEFHDKFNPIPIFLDNVNRFKRAWTQYCEKKSILKIHKNKIIDFLKHLGAPLGLDKKDRFLKIGKKILKMDIKCDVFDYVSFNLIFFSTLKNYLNEIGLFIDISDEGLNEIDDHEKTFYSILFNKNIIPNSKKSVFSNIIHKKSEIKNFELKLKTINPLFSYLMNLMAFKHWKSYTLLMYDNPHEFLKMENNSDSSFLEIDEDSSENSSNNERD